MTGLLTAPTPANVIVSTAAVVGAPRTLSMIEREAPEPTTGQVRVRLEGCGVCASNVPVWQGRPWFDYPLTPGTPGHEGWGHIDALGDGVTELTVGQRVAMMSSAAYAEHDVAAVDSIVPLPAELDDMPFPGEPLGCVMNILRRSGLESGQTVAIVGIGFIGAALTMLASRMGARVIAISRRPFALELAEHFGAHTIVRDEGHGVHSTTSQVYATTGESGCERVIECMGTQGALDIATAIAGIRSRMIIAGYHQDGDRRIDMQTWNWRGIDVINAHERDPAEYVGGIRDAIHAVRDGMLDPSQLFTHSMPLAELGDAFRMMEERPSGFLKAWVRTSEA